MEFECCDCKREFKNAYTLQRHRRIIHNVVIRRRSSEYTCAICDMSFNSKFLLTNHIREHRQAKRRLICPEDQCLYSPVSYKKLQSHLMELHKVPLKQQIIRFSTENEFLLWKRNIEKEEYSSFILNCGKKCTNIGWTKYFVCHRSYEYRPPRSSGNVERKRKSKSTGSNKTGISCPATMTLKKNNCRNIFLVEYVGTHRGHSCDIDRTSLTTDEKDLIAEKIKEGVPFQLILNEVRNSASTDDLRRIHLLKRRDLHNIRRDYKIECPVKMGNNDDHSIHLWVKFMQTKYPENNPILFYKPVNEEHKLLQKNDFALCLMTEFQEAALLEFGHDTICIDGTHGLNPYGIFLFTIAVVDEFDRALPVAFCFSNRKEYTMMKIFFAALKTRIGEIAANVFMSDGTAYFYNAWRDVMQPVNYQLLCCYHVNKNWCSNLSQKIKNPAKRDLVCKRLKTLQEETVTKNFQIFLTDFLQELKKDSDTIQFYNYFQKMYSYEPEKWALCFRLCAGINTNTSLEILHKEIKHLYLNVVNVKLDKAINALLLLVRDKLFERLTYFCKNKISEKMARIYESHLKGENFTGNVQASDEPNTWLVKEEENNWEYVVKKLRETCEETMCTLKCLECDCCVHIYQCQCNDNMIYMNMCKHIHACIQRFNANNQQLLDPSFSTADTEEIVTVLSPLENHDKNEDILAKLHLLLEITETVSYSEEQRCQLKKHLSRALDVVNGSNKKFIKKKEVYIQKNLSSQKRPLPKCKRLQSEKLNPTFDDKTETVVHFISDSTEEVTIINSEFHVNHYY